MRFTLLSRAYCHLCDEMADALAAALPDAQVQMIDVDAHPALEERFGDAVPVLFAGDAETGREVCRHRMDAAALARILAEGGKIR